MRLKKIRFILGFMILLITFQNCGGAGNSTLGGSKDSASTGKDPKGTSTPTNGTTSSNGVTSGSARSIVKSPTTSGTTFGGISSGSAGSTIGGSTGGTSTGTGGTSGTCIGCGTGGTGSGGTGGTGTIGGTADMTFKITKQPISKTVDEGAEFFVGVSVSGGKGPFKFNWYLNSEEVAPKYGLDHYETFNDLLDRIYKEGEYHVVITDAGGAKLTSSKAQIRMVAKVCPRGNYFIDLTLRTNPQDGYHYFNDLFYYKNRTFLVTQYNTSIAQMQLNNFLRYIGQIGFGYFTINQDISNNQNFAIDCATDIPTIHTSECATNNLSKCSYSGENGSNATRTYEGSINFTCRNGYVEFTSNSCKLVAPPPPPPDNGG